MSDQHKGGMFARLMNPEPAQPISTAEEPTTTPLSAEPQNSPLVDEASKLVSKEVSKFTSKLVETTHDPAVNKVGYYFTRHEIDKLDESVLVIKRLLRERYDL